MLVLGIDPGTAITGYGIIRNTDTGIELVAYGAVTTPAGELPEKRLLSLHEQLTQIIALHRPQTSAVEKLFFQRNVTTAISVGQARGVAILALAQAGIPVSEYTPLQVKQAVVGYGGADKNQVQQMVKAILNLNDIPRPDDAADALAIAICHLHTDRINQLMQ